MFTNLSVTTALGTSTLFIFIRCCYRVAELQSGFGGALANNEVDFMVLEGPMIMIATIALILFHPGFCFSGKWVTIIQQREPVIEVFDERKIALDTGTTSRASFVDAAVT